MECFRKKYSRVPGIWPWLQAILPSIYQASAVERRRSAEAAIKTFLNAAAVRRIEWLARKFVVFGVITNPKPNQVVRVFYGKCSVGNADASRIKIANLLEVQGRMAGVSFEELEVLLCEFTDRLRQRAQEAPELR